MGRHSRPEASGPTTEPKGWSDLRQRLHHGRSAGADEGAEVAEVTATNSPTTSGATATATAGDGGARRSGAGNETLTRTADQTQVIPRSSGGSSTGTTSAWSALAPPATPAPPPASAPSTTSAPARPRRPVPNDETVVFTRADVERERPASNGALIVEPPTTEPTTAEPTETEAAEPLLWGDDTEDTDAEPAANHQRLMWPALVVFWLLGLGAGVITLTSLGAPHYLCTGAAKGLACHHTGTAIAAVLTVLVIAVVGVVSVLAIEARRRGLIWLRHLGIGVVVLAIVAGGGYLLIRTIGG